MNANFSLNPHDIHIWTAWLPDFSALEASYFELLHPDEVKKAVRFRFPIHKQRYTLARGILRQLLSLYIKVPAADIQFEYGPRGKPYLRDNALDLQFNVSHSEDIAVFALTQSHEIGVDIEKVADKYKDAVAKRFFSEQEYQELCQLPEDQRKVAFYQLWAAKEALIKAVGEGLYVELNEFSISVSDKVQHILFSHANKQSEFYIENFTVHEDYQSAVATAQKVEKIFYWQWGDEEGKLCTNA